MNFNNLGEDLREVFRKYDISAINLGSIFYDEKSNSMHFDGNEFIGKFDIDKIEGFKKKHGIDPNDFYKNEGMAVFIKGKLVLGVHPDNLENNLELLGNEEMKLDWNVIKERVVIAE